MWVTQQQDHGVAAGSITRRLSSLCRYAAGWGLPVVSPISDDDHRPKFQRGRRASSARVLPAADIELMLAAAVDVRDALVVGVLFADALRVSELCAANADEVEINLALKAVGVTLVSSTETIDETPSDMLLHGNMSTIAEFFSQNLATESRKGMLQKAKAAAPLAWLHSVTSTSGNAPMGTRDTHRHYRSGAGRHRA